MKPVRRWVFNALAAGSLGLCLTAGIVWAVGTTSVGSGYQFPFRWNLNWDFFPAQGKRAAILRIYAYHSFPAPIFGPLASPGGMYTAQDSQWRTSQIRRDWGFRRGDFKVGVTPSVSRDPSGRLGWWGTGFSLEVPPWLVMVLFAVLPSIAVLRWSWRFRRRRRGLCTVCGYDLRATPERCPECGATPVKQPVP